MPREETDPSDSERLAEELLRGGASTYGAFSEHLSQELITAAVEDTLLPGVRAATLQHLTECAVCSRRASQTAEDLRISFSIPAAAPPARGGLIRRLRPSQLAVAAAALLAVGGGLVIWLRPGPDGSGDLLARLDTEGPRRSSRVLVSFIDRNPGSPLSGPLRDLVSPPNAEPERGVTNQQIYIVSPRGTVSGSRLRLVWLDLRPGAGTYRLTVEDGQGRPLWQASVDGTPLPLLARLGDASGRFRLLAHEAGPFQLLQENRLRLTIADVDGNESAAVSFIIDEDRVREVEQDLSAREALAAGHPWAARLLRAAALTRAAMDHLALPQALLEWEKLVERFPADPVPLLHLELLYRHYRIFPLADAVEAARKHLEAR